jgi:hypothetical protein
MELVVHDNLKIALELLRLPSFSQPVDNCPNCGVSSFSMKNDGICQNRTTCGYVDPQVQADIATWQQATMIQQQIKAEENQNLGKPKAKEKKKKATKEAAQQSPAVTIQKYDGSLKNPEAKRCKMCGGKSIVDGNCTTRMPDGGLCAGTRAIFDIEPREFTGIDEKALEIKGPNIRPTFTVWNSRAKKKIKASKNILDLKISLTIDPRAVPPGTMLDNSIVVADEPTTRAQEMLEIDAQMLAKQKLDQSMQQDPSNTDTETTNSEELP